MAAYAATVTLSQPTVKKLANGLAVLRGTVDVTNYNSTLAEITGITGFFKGTPTVVLGGISDNAKAVAWVPASGSIKAWVMSTDTEVANDVDVGAVPFVAFGVAP